jgi:CBS domain-containing protein
MKLVRDVIRGKSLQNLITVDPSMSIVDAADVMKQWDVGALLVMEKEALIGLLTERNLVRKVLANGRRWEGITVADVMTREVDVVPADRTTDECMGLMTHLRVRHLPVVWGGDVLGIVSIGDLVKDVIDDQSWVIEQLEAYIARSPTA